ncbi:J domain-containing protein [Crocosphaera sp. Alani8]|uniref:J domain-containing protein n=1 Tax=Crocosphaera sp. Alani8 TaxID=3038952 RepID=UPI00313E5AD4
MRVDQISSQKDKSESLGLSSFHERCRCLEEEHQWLLKQIKRKRTELKNFLDQMREIGMEVFRKVVPINQKIQELDQEIHDLFSEILTTRKLGKKSREELIGVYHSLQMMGLISPKSEELEEEEEEDFEDFEDVFSDEQEFKTAEKKAQKNANYREPLDEDNDFGSGETKSKKSGEIRKTFLKLASLFHPDKASDPETQIYNNEVMKEVNKAYEEGDIARLLEIEKQHHSQQEIDLDNASKSEIEKICLMREKDNELLRNQYENLKKELRMVRRTPEGKMVKEYRSCQKQGVDAMAALTRELEEQVKPIESIRDFVRDFRDKKITISEFLKGPGGGGSVKEEEILEMMLEELLGVRII